MARILYGVDGTGHGHAVRALTVARHFPQHDFLFVTFDDALSLVGREYPVVECQNTVSLFRHHRVDVARTVSRSAGVLARRRQLTRLVLDVIDWFRPDAAMSDYELFVPRASRLAGLPCLSLDHQHVLTFCAHSLPSACWLSHGVTWLVIRLLFSQATEYVVTSFYRPPLRPGVQARLVPPLLRDAVCARTPRDGDHVLAYVGCSTFDGFLEFVTAAHRPAIVYGFDRDGTEGPLRFERFSEDGLLDNLASCCYVISSAGHTLMSEALFYGKPVLSIPYRGGGEQQLNGVYLERLGFGRSLTTLRPSPDSIRAFERDLDTYRDKIRRERFCGNADVFALVDSFIREKRLPPC